METMPKTRLELHAALEEFLGSEYVYYRPPESKKLHYPCIIYDLKSGDTLFADNGPYTFHRSYDVQIVHKDADHDFVDEFAMTFPKCRFDRSFVSDNLKHENFVLYT